MRFTALLCTAVFVSNACRAQGPLTENEKNAWRYKALGMVELSAPYLQDDANGQRFLCITIINHLPFDVKSLTFQFEGQDEPISPRTGTTGWETENIAAGATRVVLIRPRRHIRGAPGQSVVLTMQVPDIDLCAYWPVKKKEADPWKCRY